MNEIKDHHLADQIIKRRTFAIISHPDAGKTTLTEKLLLYSGVLHNAGMVRSRKGGQAATSDWMSLEQERGISITASAMQFSYKECIINILDTPGHEDFSEDTYRTLTAADCAIMVIDAAKGVEKQTRKLFEVCRLRNIPVLTFINKMDMPSRDPLDLMQEVEDVLGIHSYAYNWPIGEGREFCGVYERSTRQCLIFSKTSSGGSKKAQVAHYSIDSQELISVLDERKVQELMHEIELIDIAGNAFDEKDFLAGKVTPVFFASALINFGVEPFFDAFIHLAPPPQPRAATFSSGSETFVEPVDHPFSAYVFKIQANMNKKHRDSTAFMRICSGKFDKDMVVKHHRLGKEVRLARPHSMIAGERVIVDAAYAGDIIGVINPGVFSVGDTVSLEGGFDFKPLPQFQPEVFAKVSPKDVGKRKSFDKGILQLAEEGTIQLLLTNDLHADNVFAAVGHLQLEVMQYRLQDEYSVETSLNLLPYKCSAWVVGDVKTLKIPMGSQSVNDRLGRLMLLFNSSWEKEYAMKNNPDHQFLDIIVA